MVPAPTKLSCATPKSNTRSSTAKRLAPALPTPSAHHSSQRLRNLASSLPSELITYILQFAASTATENSTKLHLLSVSKYYHQRLSPLVYATVALCSSSAIHSFAALVTSHPKLARCVRRLCVGPDSSSSDLITALSPPSYNQAAYLSQMRELVHASVRTVLRSCTKLYDVALAGELLSLHAAHTYASACQPVRLTSVNPHSFVGAFSAPIFRSVSVLSVVDTNLAFEEADEITTLPELEWLIWSAPKHYGDITRDTNVLTRLLQTPSRHFTHPPPPPPATGEHRVQQPVEPSPAQLQTRQEPMHHLWSDLAALEFSQGLAPARPSKNDKFRRLTIQTAHNRCIQFRTLLADSYPLYPSASSSSSSSSPPPHTDATGGLAAGLDSSFEHLQPDWDPSFNVPTIHPTPLSPAVLDEWDALRDLINNAAAQYSNLSMCDLGDESSVVDARNALKRQRQVWERIIDLGLPSSSQHQPTA